jgi:hypothetical protein
MVALTPPRFDLAAFVNRRFVVAHHYQPVNTQVARTPADFLRLREG